MCWNGGVNSQTRINLNLYWYRMNQKERQANREYVRRHRQKVSADKKRIEAWIDQPAALEVLKRQSGLNQTEVINQLIELVSDGVSAEFYRNEGEREDNAAYMLVRLLEVFQE